MEKSKGNNAGTGWKKFGNVLKQIGKWIYSLRGVLLAIPVGIGAVMLAMRNMRLLPEVVGINLLANGDYQWMIARNVAVVGPLAVTAVSLLFVFCSRRTLYPWLISLFTLTLPYIIWLTNVFPA